MSFQFDIKRMTRKRQLKSYSSFCLSQLFTAFMFTFTKYKETERPFFSFPDILCQVKDVFPYCCMLAQSSLTFLGDHECSRDSDESYGTFSAEKYTNSQFCSLFQGVPGTSEACIRTPDTEPVSESEKQVEILHDFSDFYVPYIPPVNRKQRLKSIRGNILCPYLPCDSAPLFSALLTSSWEHIFKFGSSWCLLAPIQWLIISTASFSCWDTRGLLISQYILLFDLHTNHQCWDGFFWYREGLHVICISNSQVRISLLIESHCKLIKAIMCWLY